MESRTLEIIDPEELRGYAYFKSLEEGDLGEIAAVLKVQDYADDQVLFEQGTPAEGMYVVRSGAVAIEIGGKTVATLEQGSVFGEMGLLNDRPRNATVRAQGDSQMFYLDRPDFDGLLWTNRLCAYKIVYKIALTLVDRLDKANKAS